MCEINCNVSNNFIQSDEWTKIQNKIFKTDKNLKEMIDRDSEYLRIVNITHKQISDMMTSLIDKHRTTIFLGLNELIENIFDVKTLGMMGGHECFFFK